MSLHEQHDGILETQVTWADLEKHLQKALNTSATLGTSRKVVDIGEENGFASRCGLVSCDWVGAEMDENLPKTVVIKIPSALPMKRMGVMQGDAAMWEGYDKKLRELHNIEIAAYNFLGEFEGLSIPRMYYGEVFTEECSYSGVGVTDLLRISLFALPAKERRESASALVEEMYTSMVANLDGAEPPYSLDKLHELYDILLPHSATYFAAGGIVIIAKQEASTKLSMEEKERRKAVQMDKVIGALEDILFYHSKNKELVKELKFKDQ